MVNLIAIVGLASTRALWRPFAVLGAAAAYLTLRWDAIPDRWAIHWDAAGRPNGWAERTPLGVFGPIALAAGVVALGEVVAALSGSLGGGGGDTEPDPVQLATQSAGRTVTFAVAMVIAFVGNDLPLGPPMAPGAIAALSVAVIAVALAVGLARVRSSRTARLRASDGAFPLITPSSPAHTSKDGDGYRWFYYFNASDRRLLVPKRYGLGWTLNFAHPLAWPVMLVLLAPIALIFVFRSR